MSKSVRVVCLEQRVAEQQLNEERVEDAPAMISGPHSAGGIRPATRLALVCAAICAASWLAGGGWDWDGYWLGKAGRWWAAFGVVVPAMLALAAWTQYVVKPQFTTRRDWPLAVLSFTVVRLAVASTFLITVDEAYHWQWAINLDWCYPDHPGAVGWLGALPARLFGNRLIAGRLMPTLCGSIIVCLVQALAYRLARGSGARASKDHAAAGYSPYQLAAAAGALAMITPLGATLTTLISTDYPLALAWVAAPLLLHEALRRRSLMPWGLLGLCLGFGLNGKFLGIGLVGAVVLFLALDGLCVRIARRRGGPDDRATGFAGPLAMLLLTAVCTAPILYWNARHDWMTILFNFARRAEVGGGLTGNALAWLLSQLGIVSPVVWVAAVVVGVGCGVRVVRELLAGRYHRLELMILCLTLVPLAGYVALSLVTNVARHWAGSVYSPLLALVVVQLMADRRRLAESQRRGDAATLMKAGKRPAPPSGGERPAPPDSDGPVSKRLLRRWGVLYCCGGIAFGTTLVALVPLLALTLVSETVFRDFFRAHRDPARVDRLVGEYLGWPAFAREVDALWAQSLETRRPFVMTWIYKDAAVLQFHARRVPWVHVFNRDDPYGQGYQVWRDLEAERGRDMLFISRGPEAGWHLEALRLCFDAVERLEDTERLSPAGSPARSFEIYRGRNFKGRAHLPGIGALREMFRRPVTEQDSSQAP